MSDDDSLDRLLTRLRAGDNDAAAVFRRLIRSLPTRRGVMGVATCDKGLPAMMMALAAMHDLACVLVPGGVTLLPENGEDAGGYTESRVECDRASGCRKTGHVRIATSTDAGQFSEVRGQWIHGEVREE